MPFIFPNVAHVRKHGPVGYTDYTTYKPWLRDEFQFRCVYCLERERWYPSGHAAFGVEHSLPKSDPANARSVCDYEILLYACNSCNAQKQDQLILNPCDQSMGEHVRIGEDGSMVGFTPEGKRFVRLLGLNRLERRQARRFVFTILRLYEAHPENSEVQSLYRHYFGYPDDLPNLDTLRPQDNLRPDGLNDAYFRQRADGRLPEVYF